MHTFALRHIPDAWTVGGRVQEYDNDRGNISQRNTAGRGLGGVSVTGGGQHGGV